MMKVRAALAMVAMVAIVALLAGCGGNAYLAGAGDETAMREGRAARQLDAARLLAQASMGASPASLAEASALTPAAWLDRQFGRPQRLHRLYLSEAAGRLAPGAKLTQNQFYESFWQQAVSGEDQLRQRMAFALSQIFVISFVDGNIGNRPLGAAAYYNMLGQQAFGNYRQLLEAVALHPMMGLYLSHLRNRKEAGYRVPDENFARELMQLMSIGLYQLNPDGSLKTRAGKPIETYRHEDVAALARVFTGWSWAGPDQDRKRFFGGEADPARDWLPMQNYPAFHSQAEKRFLGVAISGPTSGADDLKVALDTVFRHPNVGPFFGRQLIQRLVTSNPGPAYVRRVAAAFDDNGRGVRGDMKAVIRAVLLDPEARSQSARPARLREPVLRLAHWMRAFEARSESGRFLLGNLDDPLNGLGQTPLRSPSVFNFYRPAYVPPNSGIAAAGLVAPEMQITAEPTVTGYLNFMQDVIPKGTGSGRDIKCAYEAELALADRPALLLERVDLLLYGGAMPAALRAQILVALNAVAQPKPGPANGQAVANAKKNRVSLAIYLAMAAPEYLVQR